MIAIGRFAAISSIERTGYFLEEFRAPVGVRKSPRNEPAGRKAIVYGYFSFLPSLVPSEPVVANARRGAIRPRRCWIG
jgi:hypothetical protein